MAIGTLVAFPSPDSHRHEVGGAATPPPPPGGGVSVEMVMEVVKAWGSLEPEERQAFLVLRDNTPNLVETLSPRAVRGAVKFMDKFSAEAADELRRRYI